MQMTIKGLQEAQRAMVKAVAAMKPGGGLDDAVRFATIAALQYAVSITHVDTGALRASHRMRFDGASFFSGPRGVIYIDPASVRPGGGRPSQYGVVENFRGGTHAFYARVPAERGETIARQAAGAVIRSMT